MILNALMISEIERLIKSFSCASLKLSDPMAGEVSMRSYMRKKGPAVVRAIGTRCGAI